MLDKEKLSIAIGKFADEHVVDMEDHIKNCFSEGCALLSPDSQKAILYASKEAYFMALKTLEFAIISYFDD